MVFMNQLSAYYCRKYVNKIEIINNDFERFDLLVKHTPKTSFKQITLLIMILKFIMKLCEDLGKLIKGSKKTLQSTY